MVRTGDIASQGEITPLPDDFAIAGQTQGDLLVFDGSNWVRLAPGTADDVLTSNGPGSEPTYQTPGGGGGLILVSTTTPSGVANTGDITVAINKIYRVVVTLESSGATTTIDLRVNSQSSNYAWHNISTTLATSPVSTDTGDNSHTSIVMAPSGAQTRISYAFDLDIRNIAGVGAFAYGRGMSDPGEIYFAGRWVGSNVTSFEILVASGTFTGTVRLYEYV
jgi:hypothetical protein